MSEKARKHAKQAMLDLATKNKTQLGFWERNYKVLKEEEAHGKFTKGELITMESTKQFVDKFVMHT